jgi:hypothetical protein
MAFIGHYRQERIPAQITYIDVQRLISQRDECEIYELEGWPYDAIC